MKKFVVLFVLSVIACTSGQRITTIHLDGVQYFISRMNPYSPELNYFLAYQYCRSLGLQLASFETKEKAESVTTYLKNAGYGGYNFWTSGNRLGTTMFLWMSTGLPFNATFDFFENTDDIIQEGVLDPIDHNSNTSPQRTARDSGKEEKACVILQPPTLKWVPENCFAVKDFICEQTRCYYYNYGSIPVSSAQGRPIASTTLRSTVKKVTLNSPPSTTPIPHTPFNKIITLQEKINSSIASIKINEESGLEYIDEGDINDDSIVSAKANENDDLDFDINTHSNEHIDLETEISETSDDNANVEDNSEESLDPQMRNNLRNFNDSDIIGSENDDGNVQTMTTFQRNEPIEKKEIEKSTTSVDLPVEVRLKQISQEIEQIKEKDNNVYYHNKDSNNDSTNEDIGRQSFLSLTDLIRTLRPSEKHVIPQIDSDYSNAMRVLGDSSAIVNNNELRKLKTLDDIIKGSDISD